MRAFRVANLDERFATGGAASLSGCVTYRTSVDDVIPGTGEGCGNNGG